MTQTVGTLHKEIRMIMELACAEMVIKNEIAQGCTQKAIAQTYALAIASSLTPEEAWLPINRAIIGRWGHKPLDRIKKMAWKILTDNAKEQTQ